MDLVLLPFLLNAHKAAGVTCMTQVKQRRGALAEPAWLGTAS